MIICANNNKQRNKLGKAPEMVLFLLKSVTGKND